jgi:hypothetical protein
MTATAHAAPRLASVGARESGFGGADASVATLVREVLGDGGTAQGDGGEAQGDGSTVRWSTAQWQALSREELLAVSRELGARRRRLDAALAAAAAEIGRRSTADDGAAGLARREGYPTPGKLIAATTGGSTGEANRLMNVGRTLLGADEAAGSDDASGDATSTPEPRFQLLAEAVRSGRLSIDKANAVSTMLTRVGEKVEPTVLTNTERLLVERAIDLPFDRLTAVIRQCENQLDTETARIREESRRESRYLHIYENREGFTVIDGRLDPETAAPIKAALDAMVGDAFRRRRDVEGTPLSGPVFDDRSAPQIRADSLAALAKHCLGCDSDDIAMPNTTVMVRIAYEDLKSGVGMGQIDGFDEPVSAATLRRMAADAEIIPIVLGGPSEVLDLGRARRLFSRAQRLALGERDGGCAWCHAPPAYTEAHHIKWWYRDKGPTDIDNGVLLCSSCHHRIHRDNWGIEIRDNTVWFIPPASVDRQRKPIKGGRERFEYLSAA